jgi:hypothetical protein
VKNPESESALQPKTNAAFAVERDRKEGERERVGESLYPKDRDGCEKGLKWNWDIVPILLERRNSIRNFSDPEAELGRSRMAT